MSAEKEESKEEHGFGPVICLGHSKPVPYLHYTPITPDGYFLISACLDGKPMLREGPTGDWIGTFQGHKGAVWSARLNKDATLAVTAAGDFSAALWNSITGAQVTTWKHNHIVKSGCFSADGKLVCTGGKEKKIRIFDVNQPESDPTIVMANGAIQQLLSIEDPNLMLSCGEEKGIEILDFRTNTIARSLTTEKPVTYLSVSHDNKVLSCAAGDKILFYDTSNFSPIKELEMPMETTCVAYDPASGRVITGSSELWCRVYDFTTGQQTACNKGHHGPVRCVDFAPDGSAYASGSEDGTIRIWDDRATKEAKKDEQKA